MSGVKIVDGNDNVTGEKSNDEVLATRTSKLLCRKCGGHTHIVNKRPYCDHCGYQDGYR